MTALPAVTLPATMLRMAKRRPWRTQRLPDLVGSAEACEILNIQKMTLHRWLLDDSGTLGPNRTYMIPPKRINAGPVWVREDVERFAQEIGRRRAPIITTSD